MGIIEKQATRNVIYSYLGAGLGFITVMWTAHLFTAAEYGVTALLISYAALFAQFANLGFTSVTIRLFPYFRNKEKGHHGFLFYAIIVSIIGFLICWIVFIFLKPHLVENNKEKSTLFVHYLFYLMPLTFFTVFFNIFDSYLRAGYNSVIGSFTKDFLQKILIIGMLVLYFFKLIDFPIFILGYITSTCLPTLILLFYIIKQKEWHIKPVRGFVSKELRKEMMNLSIFSILAGGAGAIILNIDSIMVNNFLGEAETGIYRIVGYFATIMLIPARSIYRISSSIVAEKFKTNNIKEIHKLYSQSCNTQLAIGALLFIGIWTNLDNILQLLPGTYSSGKYVVLILSAGFLVEMATGINQVIIANSPYYRYDAYFVFGIVGITVLANYTLIPLYGITGSAIATALTITIGNSMRFIFLKIKFGMQPYNFNSIKLIFISTVALFPGFLMPYLHNIYIDIAIRSGVVGGIFILLILKLEATPDLNFKIRKNLKRFSISI
jgi:O-antigen/teichoic acid export membrane protein